jgi:hypothetical protein
MDRGLTPPRRAHRQLDVDDAPAELIFGEIVDDAADDAAQDLANPNGADAGLLIYRDSFASRSASNAIDSLA